MKDQEEKLKDLLALLGGGETEGDSEDGVNGTYFSLEKISPTPPELAVMQAPPTLDTPANKIALLKQKYGVKDWYEWRLKHWGTKWDIECEAPVLEENPQYVSASYRFDSAWSPPGTAIATLSKLFPDLWFHLSFDEPGMDFGGVEVYKNGDMIESQSLGSLSNLQQAFEFNHFWWNQEVDEEPA